ncbi:ScbR family autoregulator-binding transcription factor [Streptomyces sp. NPDC059002]|uniref:ScbR family autoregulator-binding transcription factor n=1 Tax=Streptomyces sp. NPDC059002 TaxID=3346690 RepID=UPI0036CC5F3D
MSKQERAARTRHALIHSAAVQFERHGYTQARLVEISAGAGVSTGALHFHFDNKEAVAQAVENEAALTLHGATYEDPGNALQALVDLSHGFGSLLRQDVVVRAGLQLSRDITRTPRRNLRQEWQDCVARLLRRAADEGSLGTDHSVEAVTPTLVAATIGLVVLSGDDKTWLARSSIARLWQLLLPQLAAPRVLETLDPSGTAVTADDCCTPPPRRPAPLAEAGCER